MKPSHSDSDYDLAVIGAGPGGYVAAIRAAQLGLRTALIDKRPTLGGTCLNIGCIPSKALLDSSELYYSARNHARAHGIKLGTVELDLPEMQKRKRSVVRRLTTGIARLMQANSVSVIEGDARLQAPGRLSIADGKGARQELRAQNILIATGSESRSMEQAAFDGKRIISSTEALDLTEVPERLLVVGAGAIGLEMASIWSRLGSQVTVLELMPEILAGWDAQLARTLRRELKKQGVDFRLQVRVVGSSSSASGVRVDIADMAGATEQLEGSLLLVAVGRRPYFDSLGLREIGVALTADSSQIEIDNQFATSLAGVWAIGDVVRGPMLAHKAEEEGIAVAEILSGSVGHVNYDTIPNVVYTSPEAAMVGMSEQQAHDSGRAYRVGAFPFSANGRALAMDRNSGMVRIIADAETDRILGAHILGPWASDLIGEMVAIMEYGGSAEDLARMSHAHPTLSEAVREAALGVDARSLHAAR